MTTKPTVTPEARQGEQPVATETNLEGPIASTVRSGDLFLVELLGLLGAALSGAAALRKLKGSSMPYAVPVTVACFKLPTGALTAVVGLLLMRADFIPGLSALDTSAQILGWAVAFGVA